jgi:hypothetical protein
MAPMARAPVPAPRLAWTGPAHCRCGRASLGALAHGPGWWRVYHPPRGWRWVFGCWSVGGGGLRWRRWRAMLLPAPAFDGTRCREDAEAHAGCRGALRVCQGASHTRHIEWARRARKATAIIVSTLGPGPKDQHGSAANFFGGGCCRGPATGELLGHPVMHKARRDARVWGGGTGRCKTLARPGH